MQHRGGGPVLWALGWSVVEKFRMHAQVTENPRAHLELGIG